MTHDESMILESARPTKVLVIGSADGIPAIVLTELTDKFGNVVEIITPEQAQEAGLNPSDFDNFSTFPIKANPMLIESAQPIDIIGMDHYKSGRETRRERRAKARNKRK